MVFYLDSKSELIQDYLAKYGKYIGMLGSIAGNNLDPKEISEERMKIHENQNEYLICSVMNGSWWNAILYNTEDGVNEIKTKYKGKPTIWYWLKRDKLEFCFHHIQKKEFEKIFK